MHDPSLSIVVIYRIMLYAAVVPESKRTILPAETAAEIGLNLVRKKKIY